ncbi:alkaline shock response membrane anchor protein AmaP [Enterococcus thailandicus]|uniref:alkaline shock response membrane anchor protein AmaP n=1 Tax=Enterococcus TaxID=1350 RepID=UPI0022E7715B|nr:alkaline shock response membrane anchor protein AmaP [Enterococcus thailandicus]MDA3966328.1 alkaline shock response membrane anchor protein AmaP [Enterococcus thailandicus]
MNKGVKVIGIIGSLVILSISLTVALIYSLYQLPTFLENVRYFVVTSFYFQQYIFWVAIVFSILVAIFILFILFYPKTKTTFVLKREHGTLAVDKKAIEGLVRTKLQAEEFIHSPRIVVRATKNRIKIKVKGELKRTSSLIGQTDQLMKEIEAEVKRLLGVNEPVQVIVTYQQFQKAAKENKHSRVE